MVAALLAIDADCSASSIANQDDRADDVRTCIGDMKWYRSFAPSTAWPSVRFWVGRGPILPSPPRTQF